MADWSDRSDLSDRLLGAAEGGGEDFHFVAVFGDGAAGDANAAGFEHGFQLVVGEGLGGVFAADQFTDDLFDAGAGHGAAVGGGDTAGEEGAQFDDALRAVEVLAGDGAADGGFVDAGGIGDLGHGHGPEVGAAEVEEVVLPADHFFGDADDSLFALVEAADEEFAGAHFFAEVLADLGVAIGLGEEVFVGVAEAEAGKGFLVQSHLEAAFGSAGDGEFGEDVIRFGGGDQAAGAGLEFPDIFGGVLDFIGIDAEDFGDVLVTTAAEGFQVVADDFVFQGIGLAEAFELEEEAFAEVAGGDSGGVEGLDGFEGGFELVEGQAAGFGEGGQGGGEVAFIVEVADDDLGGDAEVVRGIGEAELIFEFGTQGGGLDQAIEEELAFFVVHLGLAEGDLGLGEMIPPFLVDLGELFEAGLEIVDGGAVIGLGGGVEEDVGGRFGGVEGVLETGIGSIGVSRARTFLEGDFLEDRVEGQFLFDQVAQLQDGSCQQGERLLHLR